jgi:ATP-dependent helicase/nuclease subunit A
VSSVQWTDEQLAAIREVDRDVLLTAGAGSGKTAVLAQRCVYLLTDAEHPCEVDELLVLTFTEDAAAEMRRRISEVLLERVQAEPGNRRLQRHLILLDKANISTIHAFGRSLVQEFFYLLSIDPAFDVLDSSEAVFLKSQMARDLFEGVYERLAKGEGAEDLQRLVDSYGSASGDETLVDLMIQLHDFLNSLGDRTSWLERWQNEQACFEDVVRRQSQVVGRELDGVISTLAYALDFIQRFPEAKMYELHLEEKLLLPLRELQALVLRGKGDLKGFLFPRLPARKKDVDPAETGPVKALIDQAKKNYQSLAENYGLSEDEISRQLGFTRPFVGQLLALNEAFSTRYREKKRQQNVLDFDDLEVLSLELLRGSEEVSKLLQERYRFILVDEFQDVSPVQEALIETISDGPGQLFMVGDVKQSIYGFRQADPDIFLGKSKAIAAGSGGVQIELNKNFRSRSKVLEGINTIFNRCMSETLTGVDYEVDAQLYFGASYYEADDEPAVELHLIEKNPEGSGAVRELLSQSSATEREAMIVGNRIAALLAEGFEVLDAESKELRPIRYSDIVILLRSPGNQVRVWEEALGQLQIPVYAKMSEGFLQATEIQDVLSLLKVLDNMQQDIPLATVLRSPLVGLSDSQLLAIRCGDREGSFYEAVECYLREGEDAVLKGTLVRFMERLEGWRERLRFGTVAELLWGIYRQTHYLSFVRAMVGGRQRHANLLALHDLACRIESVSRQGLSRFLHYIEELENEQGDLSPAAVLTSGDNVVRIMSIHQSKGLEFPVVIVANLDRKFNPKDRNRAVLFNRHHAGSLGLRIVDPVSQDWWASLEHHLVADDIADRQLAEEMRLLYVAMTRARQRLILTASVDLEKMGQGSVVEDKVLPDFMVRAATCPVDWIGAAVAGDCFVVERYDSDAVAACMDAGQVDVAADRPGDLDAFVGSTIDPAVQSRVDEVASRIGWDYPGESFTRLSARKSVTDLKHHTQMEIDLEEHVPNYDSLGESFFQPPRFVSGSVERVSRADIGSWTHLFLQRVNYRATLDQGELTRQLDEMVREGLFTESQSGYIDLGQIENFFRDPVGQAILVACEGVRREWPFTLALPVCEVYEEMDGGDDETVIVRGIIDCLYETDEGMVIVDYKTDTIERDEVEERAASYFVPMRLYDRAVGAILGKAVTRRALYFLHPGVGFDVESPK